MCNRVSDAMVKSQERIAMWKEFTVPQLIERLYQCGPTFATLGCIVQTFVQKEDGHYNPLTGKNSILVGREDVGYMLTALRHKTNGGDKVTDNKPNNLAALKEQREQKLIPLLAKLSKEDFEVILVELSNPSTISYDRKGIAFFKSDKELVELYYSSSVVEINETPPEERPFKFVSQTDLRQAIAMLNDDFLKVDKINDRFIGASREDLSELKKELERKRQE